MPLVPPEAAAPLLPNKSLRMRPGGRPAQLGAIQTQLQLKMLASVIQLIFPLNTALNTHQGSRAGSQSRTVTPAAPSVQTLQPVPQTPPRQTPRNQHVFEPQTRGRAVANRLLSHLNTQISMASPGPQLRDQGDSESEDDDPEYINLEMETKPATSPPPRHPGPSRRSPRIQPFTQANEAGVPQQRGHSGSNLDQWNGYDIDDKIFAWASDAVLKANTRSPDSQEFFGEHIEHRSFKCKLCPQIYAAASSLSTHRTHLGNLHEPEYLVFIQAQNLPNKLPAATLRQREEKRAKDAARTLFSVKAFEDQLVTVIVLNDLSIHLIDSRDFRDLLLMLRESLQESDIPHRTKLRQRIIEAWIQYYKELKSELEQSLGKISFTVDVWSSKAMQSYLSITIHWLGPKADQVVLRQALLAF
ncbi:hypothetical protein DFH08DRAFT_950698 [Mycena albidolilacea]|uniref:C2H2-type domain-containing protein n=1 Tax=Mycena albidolilacea TaxID=1033008 RepID=A0AAD7ALN5_9AGAR|nr:hypothetical protein DFH08DRAFT_950698 [Mycena albidolilacea]